MKILINQLRVKAKCLSMGIVLIQTADGQHCLKFCCIQHSLLRASGECSLLCINYLSGRAKIGAAYLGHQQHYLRLSLTLVNHKETAYCWLIGRALTAWLSSYSACRCRSCTYYSLQCQHQKLWNQTADMVKINQSLHFTFS